MKTQQKFYVLCPIGCLLVYQLPVLQKGVLKKGQREKSPSPEKLTVYLHARTVRVGTFRGAPIEPIQLSDEGIDFYLEGIVSPSLQEICVTNS